MARYHQTHRLKSKLAYTSENEQMKACRKMTLLYFLLLLSIYGCDNSTIYNLSENFKTVPVLELYVEHDDYLELLANKNRNARIPAKIYYQDISATALIRSSGAGSRLHTRWSYRVVLQDCTKIEDLYVFNLSAQVNDPTMLFSTIATNLYKKLGFPLFKSKHVFIKINNQDQGLYLLIEIIDDDFFLRRDIPIFELYKAGFESLFTFSENIQPQFHFSKEIPENEDYYSLFELIYAIDTVNVKNLHLKLAKFLNIENYLRYHAMTSLINNPDAFQNNFYLIREAIDSPFKFIPWDFDRSFEQTSNIGLYGKNALIEKLLQNEYVLNRYISELEYQLDHIFTEENIFPIIDSTASFIEEAYNLDPYLGAGRFNFQEEIGGLKDYISTRRQNIRANLNTLAKNACFIRANDRWN
jgi:spore coat protein H